MKGERLRISGNNWRHTNQIRIIDCGLHRRWHKYSNRCSGHWCQLLHFRNLTYRWVYRTGRLETFRRASDNHGDGACKVCGIYINLSCCYDGLNTGNVRNDPTSNKDPSCRDFEAPIWTDKRCSKTKKSSMIVKGLNNGGIKILRDKLDWRCDQH